MKGGLSIGIPLTLLQYGVHHNTGVSIDWPIIANNFLVSYAVYDGDRIGGSPFSNERRSTSTATIASSLFYSEYSIPLSLLTLSLGLFYSDIKPKIAPIKPFFVAFVWTLAIYYFPLLFSEPDSKYMHELLTPAALFLSISSLSHGADICDIVEDTEEEVYTPAVLMGKEEGYYYLIATVLASSLLHEISPSNFLPYDILSICVVLGLYYECMEITLFFGVIFSIIYAYCNTETLLSTLLVSTEGSHKIAIDTMINLLENTKNLSPPVRKVVVETYLTFLQYGDSMGSKLLTIYEDLIRKSL